MISMKTIRAIMVCSAIALAGMGSAPDGHAAESTGIDVGNLVIRPSLRLSVGYNTNVFLQSKRELDGEMASPVLAISPRLAWAVNNPRSIDFNGDFGVSWTQPFAGDPGVNEDFRDQHLTASGSAGLVFNPRGAVSFSLEDRMRLADTDASVDIQEDEFGVVFSERGNDIGAAKIFANSLSASIGFHPHGMYRESRMGFSGTLSAHWRRFRYLERHSSDHSAMGGRLQLNWNFLPRSMVYLVLGVDRTVYDEDASLALTRIEVLPSPDVVNNPLRNVASTAVRVSIGYAGLIARRLSATAQIGFGVGLYEEGASPSRIGALLQLRYQINSSNSLQVGYSTDFADATFANYIDFHRLWAGWSAEGEKLSGEIAAFWQINSYSEFQSTVPDDEGGVVEVYNASERSDYILGAKASIALHITSNVHVGLRYQINGTWTDFEATRTGGSIDDQINTPLSGDPEFLRHQIMLYLQLQM